MMKLSIGRCNECSRVRLVDVISNSSICFACKQGTKKRLKPSIVAA